MRFPHTFEAERTSFPGHPTGGGPRASTATLPYLDPFETYIFPNAEFGMRAQDSVGEPVVWCKRRNPVRHNSKYPGDVPGHLEASVVERLRTSRVENDVDSYTSVAGILDKVWGVLNSMRSGEPDHSGSRQFGQVGIEYCR